MANRQLYTNHGSAALQVRNYRYRSWIARLREYGLVSRKNISIKISSGNMVRFKPVQMKRLGIRLGESFFLKQDGQKLVLQRCSSPLEVRLERLRARVFASGKLERQVR